MENTEKTVQFEEKMPYTLRDLALQDVFPMVKIINKIGVQNISSCFAPEEIAPIMEKLNGEGKSNPDSVLKAVGASVSMKIANVVLEHFMEAEQDIYKFLASISNTSVDFIKNLRIDYIANMIIDIILKPEWAGFMKAVQRLTK